jgi:alpha-1,2-mannosyltransferase
VSRRSLSRRPVQVAIVAVLVVLAAGIVYLAQVRNGYFDSKVYAGAIRHWFRDGGDVYDWVRPGTPYGFTYPPFAGLLMLPMAYLPLGAVITIAGIATIVSTTVVIWWLIAPMVRRRGWPEWFALAVASCLAVAFEPVRETFSFGQVNTLLVLLVVGDVLHGVARDRRWAGVGIGLATAIKLTPGVFILYLLVTGRWRAAATAIGTAAAVTLASAAIFPGVSREFWFSALSDSGRVGKLHAVSNQSWRGMLARFPIDAVEPYLWLVLVVATLAFWAWRVRAAARVGDHLAGLALTGVLGCLISPVTWVHHCVWIIPALVRCVDVGLTGPRRWPLWLAGAAYVLMTSRLLFAWELGPRPPLAPLGSNLYVWFMAALLIWTPVVPARRLVAAAEGRSLP